VLYPTNGYQYLFYVNPSFQIVNFTASTAWVGPTVFGGKVLSGTSPASMINPSNSYLYAYYVNNGVGSIGNFTWAGSWQGPTIL